MFHSIHHFAGVQLGRLCPDRAPPQKGKEESNTDSAAKKTEGSRIGGSKLDPR